MRTKAIYMLTLALCAGVVSSCVDEDIKGDKDVNGKAIKFGLSSQRTKTVYDASDPYQINWVTGDQIKIFCAEAESAKSALYNVTPASTAKDGTITNAKSSDVLQWGGDGLLHNFYAIYPGKASGLEVDENGIATFTINHNQKCTVTTTNGYDANVVAKPDMKNALMVAHTATEPTDEAVGLTFKPIMTTLEIVVQGPASNINSSNARVTGISIAATMTTNSSADAATFKYDIKNAAITGEAGSGEATTKTETTFVSLVDANGNASYVDLANGHTLTLTVFMPPMSKEQAAKLKRQMKIRVHITGNAELVASVKTNDASTDNWTTQIKPSSKKKITLPAIPSGIQETGNNWITPLDGNIYVSQMSIPGSHDAATGEDMATIVGDIFAQTQEQTLQAQWNLGIRAFDLRPAIYDAIIGSTHELWLYHGATRVSISWATAMNTIKANLTDHPGEFAIVLFRHEDEGTIGKDNNTTNFNTYMTNWVNANKSWIVDWRPDITIDECRGKLILISRFSGSWEYGCYTGWSHDAAGTTTTVRNASSSVTGTMHVQDYYNPSSHDAKFTSITNYLDIAHQFHTNDAMKNHWMLNHVSGYVGSSTSNTYRANAAAQNPKVIEYLHNRTTPGSTGILLFDYSGAATSGSYNVQGDVMLQTVIDNNYKYRMRRKGE
ncbi:MAG: hypothetical protein PUA96_01785 [Bacteroidales bacterium]|nr:hypothetical protein [Bacteroidales bacterium]